MKAGLRFLVAIAVIAAVALLAPFGAAIGAPAPKMSTSLKNDHPSVGDRVEVVFRISSDAVVERVSDAKLAAPTDVDVMGPTMSVRTSSSSVNGAKSAHSEIILKWWVTANQAGTFKLTPSAKLDGTSVTGTTVTMIASGGNIVAGAPGDVDLNDPSLTAKELALPSAPEPDIFIHGVADKTSALVGEQVTISFYVYFSVDFTMPEHKEAALRDFLRVPLLTDLSSTTSGVTVVGGKRFGVRLVSRTAAFPMRAGKLSSGTFSGKFTGRRLGVDAERISNNVEIDVQSPPEIGRPAGYVIGTVGQFSLKSTVEPRRVEQGGAISVAVELSGVGNLPTSLHMPAQPGIEWLDPEVKSTQELKEEKVRGTRVFRYVAKLSKAGAIDLGTVELPYFDPLTRSYEIAKAPLLSIDVSAKGVTPAPDASSAAAVDEDLLAALPTGRAKLSPYQRPPDDSFPGWLLGVGIASPPLLVAFGFAATAVGGRLLRRRRASLASSATKARGALDEARAAEKAGDMKGVAAAVERAVHAHIEDATGLKSRGVMRGELVSELEELGVPTDAATEASSILEACEGLRFAPSVDADAMAGLLKRASALFKSLAVKNAA